MVVTPSALSGIDAQHGEHLLVAEDSQAMAAQVIRLFDDTALAGRLARNARRRVEEKYTWERSVTMLEELYRLAVGQTPSGGRPS